ncbi:thymidine kinase [Candidatus Acetothermia bacterium]|nr:thymidine kinase [Candidatus Acetothermia bacterium]
MKTRGTIEVITGCMFSGKTEELIREVRRAEFAKKRIMVFDHSLDDQRYARGRVNSHSGLQMDTFSAANAEEIWRHVEEANYKLDVIAIDEAQFFESLAEVCERLVNKDMRVIAVGLNQDFRGEPFEVMAELMARADRVRLLTAICMTCGADATRTQRLINGKPAPYESPRIEIGGQEKYQARCRHCHEVPGKLAFNGKVRNGRVKA